MQQELQKKLIQRYPELFSDVGKSPQESCMHWGVEFGDGWYDVFNHLCAYLEKLSKEKLRATYAPEYQDDSGRKGEWVTPPKIFLAQCKQKWGVMTIYIRFSDLEIPQELRNKLDKDKWNRAFEAYTQKVYTALDYAKFVSSRTCELTGKPGKLCGGNYVRTLCPEKAKELGCQEREESGFFNLGA